MATKPKFGIEHEFKEMRSVKKAKKGLKTTKHELDVLDKMHVGLKKKPAKRKTRLGKYS